MPDIGYPDFQRVVNWDSPVLYSGSVTGETTYVQSGALDVSRYAYMGGYMQCYVGYCTVTLEWFLDQAMTTIVGQREFTLEQHIANICQPKIAHMGPFLQVTFEAIGNAPFTADWSLFATNRAYPLEFVPVLSVLMDNVAETLTTGSSTDTYPGSYYAGTIQLTAYITNPPTRFTIESMDLQANWNAVAYLDSGTDNLPNFTALVPDGAWRITLYNGSSTTSTTTFSVVSSPVGPI